MSEYVFTVIVVSVSIGLFHVLAPDHNGIEKYVRIVGMLVILCVMVSPITDLIKNLDGDFFEDLKDKLTADKENTEDYDKIFQEYLESYSYNGIKGTIGDMLNKEFNIPKNEMDIRLSIDSATDSPTIKNVQILLSGNSIFQNPYKIEEYIKSKLKCECQVLIKSGRSKNE